MRATLYALFSLTTLALIAGFAGRFHGMGDSIALARPILVAILSVLALIALALRIRVLGVLGIILSFAAGVTVIPLSPFKTAVAGTQSYGLYQKNLLWIIPDLEPVVTDVEVTQPDFVTLQELHERNRPILGMLREDYPYQHFCRFASVGGIAVLSRWPPTDTPPKCDDGYGLAAMQVETPDGPLWVVSLHLHWPFPYGQRRQLDTLLPVLEKLDGGAVVGGDFNMVEWSYAVRSIARATKTRNAGFAGGTFAFSYELDGRDVAKGIPRIPIDHVLVPQSGASLGVNRRERFGSDHHGLFAEFTLDRVQ